MTAIWLERLKKSYPRQRGPVLDGLSLHAQQGELIALLGPSGSGKSTILKLIAGIERPDGGDIRFDDQSILALPANRRGAVLMFQKAYLFPFMSVADNIGFGLKVQGHDRAAIAAEVARLLELVELPGIERKQPGQLSGGEQQRVALARAIITRPRVLLLDEPLSSLDTAVRQTLQAAIRRIQRELGITTILVTHDLGEAVAMSDRTALLLGGVIAACDQPARLFQRPPTRAAARFVGISTFLEGRLLGSRLETPLGLLDVGGSKGGEPRPAVFAIRPEHTRLATEGGANGLPGRVAEMLYRGEHTEYEVVVAGQRLRVRDYRPSPAYSLGDPVYVQFPPDRLFEVT